ncbi:hypothetical protein [Streptomyces macrosporus]|uniref:Vegetative cell wall protein gp1 n=1 Tax=Streptomyces macrosporus TaxID=44032 RepID=A0ABN3JW13_9ACTN
MDTFLRQLGQKLAEQWLSLLVLPGALYLAVAATARVLGHRHALDPSWLATRITEWAGSPTAAHSGGQVLLLAAVLAGAATVGLAARALGAGLEGAVLAADWRAWPFAARHWAARRTSRRRQRWIRRAQRYETACDDAAARLAAGDPPDPAPRIAAYQALLAVAPDLPDRPTWTGDRIHAAATRLQREYHLEIAVLWPHLWFVLPEHARGELTAARQELSKATVLGGWALLYAPLAWWWWPAAPLALGIALTARRRTRAAADTYAELIEALVRLHTGELTVQLGITEVVGRLTPALGEALTAELSPLPPDTRIPDDRHPLP